MQEVSAFNRHFLGLVRQSCCCCRTSEGVTGYPIDPLETGGIDTEDLIIPLCAACHAAGVLDPERRAWIVGIRDRWAGECLMRTMEDTDYLNHLNRAVKRYSPGSPVDDEFNEVVETLHIVRVSTQDIHDTLHDILGQIRYHTLGQFRRLQESQSDAVDPVLWNKLVEEEKHLLLQQDSLDQRRHATLFDLGILLGRVEVYANLLGDNYPQARIMRMFDEPKVKLFTPLNA